jgi:uncharacterized sulfatase
MKRLIAWALLLAAACCCAPVRAQKPFVSARGKPNVLFIISDDLNTDLGTYGYPLVKTPNIDRLAKRGVRFDRAYCQYPLCNPSRTSLLSGLRPDTTKVYGNDKNLQGVTWLPEYFSRHGYFSARVGKIEHGADNISKAPDKPLIRWDLQETPPRGGNAPLVLRDYWDAQKAGKNPAFPKPQQIVEYRANDNKDEEESDGITVRRIVQLMEEHKDRPFFLAAGLYRPHLPFTAPRKYFAMYPPEKIKLPKETEPVGDRDDIPPIAFTKTGEAERMSDQQKRETIAAYYACITFMDAQVGVLLDEMDRRKLWDNTVVVFMGDHGFHLGEHAGRGGDLGLWRKSTLFEESARSPLIIAAPGFKKEASSKRLVEFVDIYPTLVELCGLPARPELDGQSLTPLLSDPHRAWRPAAFSQVTRGGGVMGRSVRTEQYRYTEWGDAQTAELYDHRADPREYRNLASDPAHAATLAQMKRLLQEGATFPIPRNIRSDTEENWNGRRP